MSACSDAIARRFGDGGPSGEGTEDSELIRRVLSRKTVRRYSNKMPAEDLLDLLVACALSAPGGPAGTFADHGGEVPW